MRVRPCVYACECVYVGVLVRSTEAYVMRDYLQRGLFSDAAHLPFIALVAQMSEQFLQRLMSLFVSSHYKVSA